MARIFAAKGRPRTSPLIVHVDSIEMARGLAAELARCRRDPGAPLLARSADPGGAQARRESPISSPPGLPTVGLRMPAHPLALALIRAAGVPIAAPSANRFTELSPTAAAHVPEALADYVARWRPRARRHRIHGALAGGCAHAAAPRRDSAARNRSADRPDRVGRRTRGRRAPSPGMHARHYRPATPLYLLTPRPSARRHGRIAADRPRNARRPARLRRRSLRNAAPSGRAAPGLDRGRAPARHSRMGRRCRSFEKGFGVAGELGRVHFQVDMELPCDCESSRGRRGAALRASARRVSARTRLSTWRRRSSPTSS